MSEESSKVYGIGCIILAPVLVVIGLPLLLIMGAGGGYPTGGGGTGGGGPLNPAGIPAAYVPMLQAAAKYCPEVTAPALAAQLKQESGWNPNARSPVGASGLAQFMPATWATWGQDTDHSGSADPTDPADAIDAQGRFMCSLIAMMKPRIANGSLSGNVLDLAWAAYNAGPGNVFKLGGIPPFTETQQYVKILRQNMLAFEQAPPVPAGDGKFMNPLAGQPYTLTSGFGPRPAPCAGCSTFHYGQDMAIGIGTPIKAACTGQVVAAAYPLGGMGMATVIYCGGGVRTYYAHQSKQMVTVGQSVTIGQLIGYTGNTGNSSGPHLHFEIHSPAPAAGNWYAGTQIDPDIFMRAHGAPL